ncbi:uncharacterized protein LOC120354685 [Nilaparvata lugens]|uniref:uncharacterized protein LOC120354685 n=1 Tax=Nilaparvata lugens TaxID=108931 RepID=UPI00193DF460|nr:uncharacterized protein LOC120354685 [Nilaparvata lugens]
MLRAGKMNEIAEEILKYKFDLVALQEVRWKGQGRIDKSNYSLLYSGPEQRTGMFGTGFIVAKKLRGALMEFEALNERMCRVCLKGKFRNVSVLSVHAPTNEKNIAEKEVFYEQLEEVCAEISKYDQLIFMGDFNAQIGKESYLQQVAGKYTLHEKTNENGFLLGQFTIRNDMQIRSTQFPHKSIHLGTWKSPDATTINQIDHVIVDSRNASSIIDVRSCRGPNCDSDHFIVKVVVRQRLSMLAGKQKVVPIRWDVEKLKSERVRSEYLRLIQAKTLSSSEADGVEEVWTKLANGLKEAANEAIGQKRWKRNEGWYDNECREAIREKNEARSRMIQRETRRNYEDYKEKRRIANRTCRTKKREALNKQLEEIESLYKQNETKKFYRAMERINKEYRPRIISCKDKRGRVLNGEDNIMERWAEHFRELLTVTDINEENVHEGTGEPLSIEAEFVAGPTLEETEMAVKHLKNGKAGGQDNILAEMIKYGGDDTVKRIHELISMIWRDETMPQDWNIGQAE